MAARGYLGEGLIRERGRAGGVKPGMRVEIIGVGGLGQFAVRIAVAKGCEVYVATRKPSAQERALSLGAKKQLLPTR